MEYYNLYLFSQFHITVEALAVIAGCITWNKWKYDNIRWLIGYLCIIFILELQAHLFVYYKMGDCTNLIKEIEVPFEMIFINWFFYKIIVSNKKKITLIGITAYITTWLLEKTLIDSTGYFFDSLSYTVGNLFILIYLILFFIEFVSSEKILAFNKQGMFWIALGMLFFYLGTFPFYGLYNELMKNMDIYVPYAWAATGLNYVMYILFTIGLIWGKPD